MKTWAAPKILPPDQPTNTINPAYCVKKVALLFLFIISLTAKLSAQDETTPADSTITIARDTAVITVDDDDTEAETVDAVAEDDNAAAKAERAYKNVPADSSQVEKRSFSETKIDELRKDAGMQYTETPTVAESVFDRIWQWIGQLIESIFDASTTTNWGRILTWAIALTVIIAIVFMVLKVNAFKVFFSGAGASSIKHTVFDENIHEMDFEKLIQDAINQGDYRKGVRLVFLYSLKMLADRQLIHWEQGKTNHDYVAELKAGELRNGLDELSLYFDYAWYGNFNINVELFNKVNDIFVTWKTKLR